MLDHDTVVVVVSAMSGETNRLLALAKEVAPNPDPRELDVMVATGKQVSIALVSMALMQLGLQARSYTGAQVRILTDSTFTKARIVVSTIDPTLSTSSLPRSAETWASISATSRSIRPQRVQRAEVAPRLAPFYNRVLHLHDAPALDDDTAQRLRTTRLSAEAVVWIAGDQTPGETTSGNVLVIAVDARDARQLG